MILKHNSENIKNNYKGALLKTDLLALMVPWRNFKIHGINLVILKKKIFKEIFI